MSVQINLTESELKTVKSYAAQTGIPIDAYIKQALLKYIEETEEAEDEQFILKGFEEIRRGEGIDGQPFIGELMNKYDSL